MNECCRDALLEAADELDHKDFVGSGLTVLERRIAADFLRARASTQTAVPCVGFTCGHHCEASGCEGEPHDLPCLDCDTPAVRASAQTPTDRCEYDFDGCPGDCPGAFHQRAAGGSATPAEPAPHYYVTHHGAPPPPSAGRATQGAVGHEYLPLYAHRDYCGEVEPNGWRCGRWETDPIHQRDEPAGTQGTNRNWANEPTAGQLGIADPPQLGPDDYPEERPVP